MIGITESKNRVPIRLTEERWYHIAENHEDLAGFAHAVLDAIENPDIIVKGWLDECLAIRKIRDKKHLVVAYKEISKNDGFVIAAYFTKDLKRLMRRKILWQQTPQ